MTNPEPTQLDKFKQAARELEADEDEARWDERLKGLVRPTDKAGEADRPPAKPQAD
jgi:hypothetical protein